MPRRRSVRVKTPLAARDRDFPGPGQVAMHNRPFRRLQHVAISPARSATIRHPQRFAKLATSLPVSTHQGKILVVDDDRLVLATLAHGLSEAGYDVIDADNGDDAILLAREHRPDLALLDIRMEGMSGFEVAAYLRDHCQMPFMFLSAFADDQTVAQVKALGAVDYLVKPLDIRQIVPAVEGAFEQLRQRRLEVSAASPDLAIPSLHAPQPKTAPALAVEVDLSLPSPAPHPLAQPVSIAVGVLMHRYSLSRQAALARLERMAAAESRPLHEQAERLLEAVELLSVSGQA
jgi:CheY-like chemotaxis protein